METLDEAARSALYRELRGVVRTIALRNPLVAGKPLVFLQRRRFICQMLHEYLGYFYDYGDIAGGGVYVLEQPGHSLALRDLVAGRLAAGQLHHAGHCRTTPRRSTSPLPSGPTGSRTYYSPERRCFHLFAMDADGGESPPAHRRAGRRLRSLPAARRRLAFMSTRRGGFRPLPQSLGAAAGLHAAP